MGVHVYCKCHLVLIWRSYGCHFLPHDFDNVWHDLVENLGTNSETHCFFVLENNRRYCVDLEKRHCLDMDKRYCFNRLKTTGISCLVLGKNHRLNWLKTVGSSCLGRNIYF